MRTAMVTSVDIDKGLDLARLARSVAVAGNDYELDQLSAENKVPTRITDAVKVIRSAVAEGRIDGATWGSELAPYTIIVNAFMDSLRNTGAFFRLLDGGMLKVPLRSKLTAVTAGASAYIVGEGSAKRMSRLSLETEAIDPFHAAAFVIISQELANIGALADPLIAHELRGAVAATADEKFLAILDAGASTSASSGSTVSAVQQDLKVALDALTLGQSSRLYFITHPDRVKLLSTMTIDGGFAFADINPVSGGLLLKTPLIPCDACASDAFYAVDASGIAGNSLQIVIDRFKHATVQMDDAPDSPTTASTTIIPLWQRNLICLQASTWAGAKVVRSNSVYKLSSVDWGTANSP